MFHSPRSAGAPAPRASGPEGLPGGPAQGLRVGSAGPGLAPPFSPPLAALRLSPNRQCLRLLSWGQDGSGRWQDRVETWRPTECGARRDLGNRLPARRPPAQPAPAAPRPLSEIWAPRPPRPHLHSTRERCSPLSDPFPKSGYSGRRRGGGWRRALASARRFGKTSPPGLT